MTDIIQQPVHIIQVDNPITEINYQLCMARKANKSQCSHRKKFGDYCGVHYNKPDIQRIDLPIPEKKKGRKNQVNKDTIINTIKDNDKSFKYSVELGARNIDKIILIQRVYRGWIVRHFNKLRGPALFNRSLCNNADDIYLFEPIKNIHINDFFSLNDKDGFIYGFHIESIYNYIESNRDKDQITNPYNKNPIGPQVLADIENLYRHCKTLGFHDKITNELPTDEKFVIRNKVLTVFQQMDKLNNYTDIEWFMGLTHIQLLKLLANIKDLFEYRLQLSGSKKYKIVKNGQIFIKANSIYKHMQFQLLRHTIIDEFSRLINEGETRDDQYLGSLIILTGLVELVPSCAQAYPWLVQGSFDN